MHVAVIHVSGIGLLVRLGAESRESHFVEVYPKRVYAIEKYVKSQIVLKVFDKMRTINVLLNYVSDFFAIYVMLLKKHIFLFVCSNI